MRFLILKLFKFKVVKGLFGNPVHLAIIVLVIIIIFTIIIIINI